MDRHNYRLFLAKKLNLGICIAPTQPFRAALGAESRVFYPGNTADRQTKWALTSHSQQQIRTKRPPLGFEPAIFGMLAHLSDHSAKSHPQWVKLF
jgi:hypothetical protein